MKQWFDGLNKKAVLMTVGCIAVFILLFFVISTFPIFEYVIYILFTVAIAGMAVYAIYLFFDALTR